MAYRIREPQEVSGAIREANSKDPSGSRFTPKTPFGSKELASGFAYSKAESQGHGNSHSSGINAEGVGSNTTASEASSTTSMAD